MNSNKHRCDCKELERKDANISRSRLPARTRNILMSFGCHTTADAAEFALLGSLRSQSHINASSYAVTRKLLGQPAHDELVRWARAWWIRNMKWEIRDQ